MLQSPPAGSGVNAVQFHIILIQKHTISKIAHEIQWDKYNACGKSTSLANFFLGKQESFVWPFPAYLQVLYLLIVVNQTYNTNKFSKKHMPPSF